MPKDKLAGSTVTCQAFWRALLKFGAQTLALAGGWWLILAGLRLLFDWVWLALALAYPPAAASVSGLMIAAYVLGLYLILWFGISRFARQQNLSLAVWRWPALGMGFGSALLLLSLLFAAFGSLGWLRIGVGSSHWPAILLQSLSLGVGVAWIEERLFRDLLLKGFGRVYSLSQAVFLQAVLFSLVHQGRGNWPLDQRLLSLVGLILVGLFLGQIASRYQWCWAVGLHAGWIAFCSFGAQAQLWLWEPGMQVWHGAGNPVESASGLLVFSGLNLLYWQLGPGLKNETESGLCSDTLQKPVS